MHTCRPQRKKKLSTSSYLSFSPPSSLRQVYFPHDALINAWQQIWMCRCVSCVHGHEVCQSSLFTKSPDGCWCEAQPGHQQRQQHVYLGGWRCRQASLPPLTAPASLCVCMCGNAGRLHTCNWRLSHLHTYRDLTCRGGVIFIGSFYIGCNNLTLSRCVFGFTRICLQS